MFQISFRKTYEKWPCHPTPYLVSDLAKEGFFYLGDSDRTQCFSCSGVLRNWVPSDIVTERHKESFPNCKIHRGQDTGNLPMTNSQRRDMDLEYRAQVEQHSSANSEPPDPSPEQQYYLAQRFVCMNAINPHMASLDRRIETFDHRWPKNGVTTSVASIAHAGFFYTGVSVKTSCFYCDGCIQSWESVEEPWTEHAKHFPQCQYVVWKKGIDFIQRLQPCPNLNGPFVSDTVSVDLLPMQHSSPNSSDGGSSVFPTVSANIDMQQVENIGFPRETIGQALERAASTPSSTNTSELMQLLDQSDDISLGQASTEANVPPMNLLAQPEAAEIQNKRTTLPRCETSEPRLKSLELNAGNGIVHRLREMEQGRMCRLCKTSLSEIVLLPCGHLCVCDVCAHIKRCPICRKKVIDQIKVFRHCTTSP